MKVGDKFISVEKSRRVESKDLVLCEQTHGKKYSMFLSEASARRMMAIAEDLVMEKYFSKYWWSFSEANREVTMEIVSNRFSKSLMVKSVMKDEKKWRRRVFIPCGEHGEGWLALSRKIRSILSSEKMINKHHIQPASSLQAPSFQSNRSDGWKRIEAIPVASNRFGAWEFAVVCKVDMVHVNWYEIGARLLEVYNTNEEFDIFPFEHNMAIITAYSEEEREILCAGNEVFGAQEKISIFPWYPSINNRNAHLNPNGGWIGLQGLPFHLWTCDLFQEIASKFGGLEEIAEDSRLCNDLQIARLKVKGDLGKIPNRIIVEEGDEQFIISVHCINEPRPNPNPEAIISIKKSIVSLANQDQPQEDDGLESLIHGTMKTPTLTHEEDEDATETRTAQTETRIGENFLLKSFKLPYWSQSVRQLKRGFSHTKKSKRSNCAWVPKNLPYLNLNSKFKSTNQDSSVGSLVGSCNSILGPGPASLSSCGEEGPPSSDDINLAHKRIAVGLELGLSFNSDMNQTLAMFLKSIRQDKRDAAIANLQPVDVIEDLGVELDGSPSRQFPATSPETPVAPFALQEPIDWWEDSQVRQDFLFEGSDCSGAPPGFEHLFPPPSGFETGKLRRKAIRMQIYHTIEENDSLHRASILCQ